MEPIVGLRAWRIELGQAVLRSIYIDHVWPAGVATARCYPKSAAAPLAASVGMRRPHDPEVSPVEKCVCGLYARTTLPGCLEEFTSYPVPPTFGWGKNESTFMVLGAALLWGDVVLRGPRVIRAQHGRVLCLTESPTVWQQKPGSNATEAQRQARLDTIDAVCIEYGLPMIPWENVMTYAAEFGELAA